MDRARLRSMTSQLAEDLGWLEEHAHKEAGLVGQAQRLRLAAGLVRNVLGPWLENQPTKPLHLAIVGGAGAGKSTLANFICGGQVAESNPQAGFTRHPVAYISSTGSALPWADYLGFLGPLRRLTKPTPSNFDEDVYQVRRVSTESKDLGLLENLVVWDCPDMTTTAATGYVSRLLEVASLADVVIYVASDERYNDEVPTQFLKLLLDAGKMVIVCLVKVREADAPAFAEHFQQDVVGRFPRKPAVVMTIPQLTLEQLQDPVEKAGAYRDRLVQEVRALIAAPEAARKRNVRAAIDFLKEHQNDLQNVAQEDLAALEAWRALVQEGQVEFEQRYRREYLTGERFRRFDEAMYRLLDLLDMPGMGRFVSGILFVLRAPYRWLRGVFASTMQSVLTPAAQERPVLDAARTGWLDHLRKEAARRSHQHPLWALVQQGFARDLGEQAKDRFEQFWRKFHATLSGEIDASARRISEGLERRTWLLNLLRWAKLGLEAASIFAVFWFYGIGLLDIILIPLAVSVIDHVIEFLVRVYVDIVREGVRARQQALITQHLSLPLAEWLIAWPTTGGSVYERLHIALRRINPAIAEIDQAVAL